MGFRLILCLTLMCFGVFLYVISPEDISAHGRLDRIEKKEFKKYEIGFGTNPSPPRVGFTRLIVTLDDRDTQAPIIGESITIVGVSPNSEKITVGPLIGSMDFSTSSYHYHGDINIDQNGKWEFLVMFEIDDIQVSIPFQSDVRNSNIFPVIISTVILISFIIIIAFSLRGSISNKFMKKNSE